MRWSLLNKRVGGGKRLYLWGAGVIGKYFAQRLHDQGILVTGFMDKDKSLHHTEVVGYKVYSPLEILTDSNVFILVTNKQLLAAMQERLQLMGFLEGEDFISYTSLMKPLDESPPPNTIPEDLRFRFTMNENIPVSYEYIDRRPISPQIYSEESYRLASAALEERTTRYFGSDSAYIYDALGKYGSSIDGKSIAIWGSNERRCDAAALWKNANHVYVIDPNEPVCEHKDISVITYKEMCEQNIMTDCAMSFSSLEYTGLGSCGNLIDPDGDLKAMRTVWEQLNEGGTLFLTIPIGSDYLCWNTHRIYGEKRLPLLLKGWTCLDVFFRPNAWYGANFSTANSSPSLCFPFTARPGVKSRALLVLQKKAPGIAGCNRIEPRLHQDGQNGIFPTCNLALLEIIKMKAVLT